MAVGGGVNAVATRVTHFFQKILEPGRASRHNAAVHDVTKNLQS
jgi:hypothetical protein